MPSKAARKEARQGRFDRVEEAAVDAVKQLGVRTANVIGYSFAAELASGFAIAAAGKVCIQTMFVMGSPSELKRSRRELIAAEKAQQALYESDHLHPFDIEQVGAYGYGKSQVGRMAMEAADLYRYFRHPGVIADYATGMAAGKAHDQRLRALQLHPKSTIVIGILGNDTVAPRQATLYNARKLQAELPGRVHYFVMPGEDHGFEDQSERYAQLTKKVLRSTS